MNATDADSLKPSNRDVVKDPEALEPVSLKQIAAFLAVAELHSMTKAAERLHMSQSGLSRVISGLECVIGEKLFDRTPSGLSLSPTGSELLPCAYKLQSRYAAALASAKNDTSHSQEFTVACTELIFPVFLPEIMALRNGGDHDEPRWRLLGMNSAQVVREVESGRADLGLCMNVGETVSLISTPLLRAPLGILAAPSMRVPSLIPSLSALDGIPMIRLSEHNMLPGLIRACSESLQGYFGAPMVAETMASLFAAVRTGNVASIVSGIAASLPQASGLQFVPLGDLLPSIQLLIVSRKPELQSSAGSGPVDQLGRAVLGMTWPKCVERLR